MTKDNHKSTNKIEENEVLINNKVQYYGTSLGANSRLSGLIESGSLHSIRSGRRGSHASASSEILKPTLYDSINQHLGQNPTSIPSYIGYTSTELGIGINGIQTQDRFSFMDIREEDITFERIINETYLLSKLAFPIVISYILQNVIPLASVYSLGHLGPTELAASALSNMFASVTGWSVAMGMATALDTLCSQAFTGSNNIHVVGIYLQRGILISLSLLIPVSFLWWYSEAILLLLKQDEDLAYYCGRYLKILLLGAPPYVVFECLKKFLQAQDIMTASTYILFSVIPVNLGLNYLLVFYEPTRLGFDGAPLTVALTNWCMMILCIIYIRLFKGSEAWGGWTLESLDGWYEFLKLGIPGIIMVCAEWWAFEIMGLAASYLGKAPLAAHSVSLTTCNLFYMVPLGLSIAASNRMGNLLGDATANRAKLCALAALFLALIFALINSSILIIFKQFWGYLFTNDESVALLAQSILPIAALFQVFDGLSGVSGGILRGQGRQQLGAIINVIAYYILSLPIGLYLAFNLNWGIYGLWWGLAIALFLCAIVLVLTILFTNWNEQVTLCQERIQQDEIDNLIVNY